MSLNLKINNKKVNIRKLLKPLAVLMGILTIGLMVGLSWGATYSNTKINSIEERLQQIEDKNNQLEDRNKKFEQELNKAKDAITFNPDKLLSYTNQERKVAGVNKLSLNKLLNQSATNKAQDMINKGYWAHDAPEGTEPWVFIQDVNYNYTKAGENLAFGFKTGQETIIGWMNSATHKKNMLDSDFTNVGFGILRDVWFQEGINTVVVAHYGSR